MKKTEIILFSILILVSYYKPVFPAGDKSRVNVQIAIGQQEKVNVSEPIEEENNKNEEVAEVNAENIDEENNPEEVVVKKSLLKKCGYLWLVWPFKATWGLSKKTVAAGYNTIKNGLYAGKATVQGVKYSTKSIYHLSKFLIFLTTLIAIAYGVDYAYANWLRELLIYFNIPVCFFDKASEIFGYIFLKTTKLYEYLYPILKSKALYIGNILRPIILDPQKYLNEAQTYTTEVFNKLLTQTSEFIPNICSYCEKNTLAPLD